MARLRVHNVSLSLDGHMAFPEQALEQPLGRRGEEPHRWMFRDDRCDAGDRFVRLGDE